MPSQLQNYLLLIAKTEHEYARGNDKFDLATEGLLAGLDWHLMIKAVCCLRKCSFDRALEYFLGDLGWNAIVQKRLVNDPNCRKLAYQYCRRHPDNGLIKWDGDRYTIVFRPTR